MPKRRRTVAPVNASTSRQGEQEGAREPPSAAAPLLLRVHEAARLLGIGTTLAYELIGQGRLPHIRLGRALRVPRRALEEHIAASTRGVTTGAGTRP